MKRHHDWNSRLLAKLAEQERVPSIPGESDCLLKLSETVQAMTGTDLGAQFRGRYSSVAGGYRVLKKDGFDGPLDFLSSERGCGFQEIHISEARDGDIGAILQDGHWAFGHIVGPYFYPATDVGSGILPRSKAEKVFRVA